MSTVETKGYIKVFRRLHNHWLWEDKPFGKGQAWVDLMLLASYCTSQFRHGNQVKVVHRGTMLTSVQKLAARWGWSTKKVGNFLTLLEKERMVMKHSYKTHTTITLLNYDQWQGEVMGDISRQTAEGTSPEPGMDNSKDTSQGTSAEMPQPIDLTHREPSGETHKTQQGHTKGQRGGVPGEDIQEVKEVKEVKKGKEGRPTIEPHQQRHGKTDQYKKLNICLAQLDL